MLQSMIPITKNTTPTQQVFLMFFHRHVDRPESSAVGLPKRSGERRIYLIENKSSLMAEEWELNKVLQLVACSRTLPATSQGTLCPTRRSAVEREALCQKFKPEDGFAGTGAVHEG
jgi:hypothetical protein